ncbi:MAG: hypothetical protein ACLFVT_07155 [Syntrophobacteria bacterium]
MSFSLLLGSVAVGIVVVCIGLYRAYKEGEFMLMILGMLILVSCAANYVKRQAREEEDRDSSSDDPANR